MSKEQYERTDKKLILRNLPSGDFTVDIEVQIKPQVRLSSRPCCLSHTLGSARCFCVRVQLAFVKTYTILIFQLSSSLRSYASPCQLTQENSSL